MISRQEVTIAARMTIATLVLTGIAYPLVVTKLAHWFFPQQAAGSWQNAAGRVVGSELIGQPFTRPAYFQGRPSAAGAGGYDASASGGSNLGPTSGALRDRIAADTERLAAANPEAMGPVPVELVLASGSGLDPHVSPEAAFWQAARVARARGVPAADVGRVVLQHIEGRTWGLLGEPRVNVLRLNVDLDRQFGSPPAATP
jgi:potassium-transporting ATPase KdpC subunit